VKGQWSCKAGRELKPAVVRVGGGRGESRFADVGVGGGAYGSAERQESRPTTVHSHHSVGRRGRVARVRAGMGNRRSPKRPHRLKKPAESVPPATIHMQLKEPSRSCLVAYKKSKPPFMKPAATDRVIAGDPLFNAKKRQGVQLSSIKKQIKNDG